jgi:pimeloyl-ACP methyl ester carboxylesterase
MALTYREQRMATFVLVHGGFHGGWCYSRVAKRLRAQGHDVYTPTLSGVGERAHLAAQAINLSTHIQDVVATILNEDLTDVILCGHSYGGMVITGVAGQVAERIRTLFYLDASVPEDGQSLLDVRGPEAALSLLEGASETGSMVAPLSAQHFQVNADDVEWVDRLCTPHPVGCFIQKLRYTGKEELVTRRTYVLAERFGSPVTHAAHSRVTGLPGWKTVSLDCGHDVMVDLPDELAALLLQEVAR